MRADETLSPTHNVFVAAGQNELSRKYQPGANCPDGKEINKRIDSTEYAANMATETHSLFTRY